LVLFKITYNFVRELVIKNVSGKDSALSKFPGLLPAVLISPLNCFKFHRVCIPGIRFFFFKKVLDRLPLSFWHAHQGRRLFPSFFKKQKKTNFLTNDEKMLFLLTLFFACPLLWRKIDQTTSWQGKRPNESISFSKVYCDWPPKLKEASW
jgi:hypothetical protein